MKTAILKNVVMGAVPLSAIAGYSQEAQHFSFKDLPSKQLNELLTRSTISGEAGTIGYFTYKKDAVVPMHQHVNEQYSLITQGSVKVLVAGKEVIVKAGEGIIIPPNVPHSFIALEDDTIDIDFFSPARMDWLAQIITLPKKVLQPHLWCNGTAKSPNLKCMPR